MVFFPCFPILYYRRKCGVAMVFGKHEMDTRNALFGETLYGDRQTDRRADGRTDRQTDGQTDRRD